MSTTEGRGIDGTWVHKCPDIPPNGLDMHREALAEERAAAAKYLNIPAVERLVVDYRIAPASKGRYRLDGAIRARVVQTCVVSLEPVVTNLAEEMDVEFGPDRGEADAPTAEGEIEVHEAVELEPIVNNRIEAGRVVLETLLAALPAFPRAADAELELKEAGPAEGAPASPFATLANWKPKTP